MKKELQNKTKYNAGDLVTIGYLDMRLGAVKTEILEEMFSKFATREEMFSKFITREEMFDKFATREEMRDEVRRGTLKVLEAVDKILTRFDAKEKDEAAHNTLHGRISDKLLDHDMRLKKIEAKS